MGEAESTSGKLVRAVMALGSNLPDRLEHLRRGLMRWRQLSGVEVVSVSRVYESPPEGPGLSGSFLNACLACDVTLTPSELLEQCRAIERECGRNRDVEEESGTRDRTLDCDIIFYGDENLSDPELTIPHPRWSERAFVLLPLMDLRADLTESRRGLLDDAVSGFELDWSSCRGIENVLN